MMLAPQRGLIASVNLDARREIECAPLAAARGDHMASAIEPLILDFLEWLSAQPRPYDEAAAAWRTSCPRLTVWEDAIDRGYVTRKARGGRGWMVELTDQGRAMLAAQGRAGAGVTSPGPSSAAG